jgi:CheY-like chemotaxis protein
MRKYRILIVENDEDEQFFMREGFSSSSFEIVAQLNSGDELIEWLERRPQQLPEVILSDLNMPGKNGFDIIDYVTSHPAYAHIPVIITSTSSTPATIDKCMSKGASYYITKPDTFVEYPKYAKSLYDRIEEKQLVRSA